MFDLPLRIGITGSAGTGKTTLVTALAAALKLPIVEEEVRCYLTSPGGSRSVANFRRLPEEDRRRILEELFERRVGHEQALDSFIADTTCLDYTAHALHHGIYDGVPGGEPPHLLTEPARIVRSYDIVFVLPHGALPYECDGVRSDSLHAELRSQHLLESVLHRSIAPHRVHSIPRGCTDLLERTRFVLDRLRRMGLIPGGTPAPPQGKGGVVYLVGAGPGDPELLTLRAHRLLETADVIATDKLLPPELLASLPATAEVVSVGHRGRGVPKVEGCLHPAVLAAAREGKRVVRLKAGDPMVFGRGAEEAEELRAAGVPYEIVPGISAALGAASYAAIPLTHRDHASDVTFATGHETSSGRPSRTNWESLGSSTGTVVLYMAAHRLEGSLARLVDAGRSASTPAAYIAGATHGSQRVLVGDLSNLAAKARDEDRTVPGLVIVGEVVARGSELGWLRVRRPLFGRRLLVARARPGSSVLASELRGLGAQVIESPLVECGPLGEPLRAPDGDFTGVVLGDVDTVRYLHLATVELPSDVAERLLAGSRVALTPGAARALADPTTVTAEGSCREALGRALRRAFGQGPGRLLVPGPKGGRPQLVETLGSLGFQPVEFPVFRQSHRPARDEIGAYDAAIYPSSSAARAVLEGPWTDRLREVLTISIGPLTTRALGNLGVRWIEQAPQDSIDSVVARTLQLLGTGANPVESLP